MQYGHAIAIFDESGLSPEELARWIGVSNSTYRRWRKLPPGGILPEGYRQNITAGIYNLLSEGRLSYDSPHVAQFMEQNIPDFFKAAAGQFDNPSDLFSENSTHQEKITTLLSRLGSNTKSQQKVDKARKDISKFAKWGGAWKQRIQILSGVLIDKKLTLVDRLVAYGALFYLILPFDLIPDAIPVFGYVDDFGILGFATAYYVRRFPHIEKVSSSMLPE